MSAAQALAEAASRLTDLLAQRDGVQREVKELRGRIEALRAARAAAMADGGPVPPRASLAALESELVDADALLAEVDRRLAATEEDHARLRREAWREEASEKRAEAARVQIELTQATADAEARRRHAGTLAQQIDTLIAEASALEGCANQR